MTVSTTLTKKECRTCDREIVGADDVTGAHLCYRCLRDQHALFQFELECLRAGAEDQG